MLLKVFATTIYNIITNFNVINYRITEMKMSIKNLKNFSKHMRNNLMSNGKKITKMKWMAAMMREKLFLMLSRINKQIRTAILV